MIWATVSSSSCFCWEYNRSFSIFGFKEHNLISVLTIWWCPGAVISWVVGKGCLLWPACSLDKAVRLCCLHFVLQDQTCLLFWVSLDFLILHSNPLWWKGHPFLVFILDVVGLNRTNQLQILWHQGLGHRLRLLWYWMACFGNKPRTFCCFWDCTEYCILYPLIDYESHSISSKGIFLTVVDIMVIWINLGLNWRK